MTWTRLKPVIIGNEYGSLKVISLSHSDKRYKKYFNCLCECGRYISVRNDHLAGGRTKSCGCTRIEKVVSSVLKHGQTKSPIYKIWTSMIQRCHNPNSIGFKYYGAKGVKVCDRWRFSFENFMLDIGDRPSSKHSLDRHPDQKGDYTPSNVRWATMKQQMRNMSRNHWIEYDGKRMILTDWAEYFGIKQPHLSEYLSYKPFSEIYEKYKHG